VAHRVEIGNRINFTFSVSTAPKVVSAKEHGKPHFSMN
jgi:hypothetical protein